MAVGRAVTENHPLREWVPQWWLAWTQQESLHRYGGRLSFVLSQVDLHKAWLRRSHVYHGETDPTPARSWQFVQDSSAPVVDALKSGWWFEPLWKIWKSIGMMIPNIWENKKCSKPPTRNLPGCFWDAEFEPDRPCPERCENPPTPLEDPAGSRTETKLSAIGYPVDLHDHIIGIHRSYFHFTANVTTE